MNITVTTDLKKFDIPLIFELLSKTHWAAKRDPKILQKSFETSLCFGAFHGDTQLGFGRVITDYATTAYICDMVVRPEFRGKGIGTRIMQAIMDHPDIRDLKWILRTRDAASLYARFGFKEAEMPGRFMEKFPEQSSSHLLSIL